MSARFEELDWAATPIGEVSLRRRLDPVTGEDVFEVKLDDEWLMSSQFTAAEIALARLGLARQGQAHTADDAGAGSVAPTTPTAPATPAGLDVVVGGLGLGYTAQAALEDARVGELLVVELLEPVIDWHERGLVPVGPTLTSDPRCRFVQGDFFAMSHGDGYDPAHAGRLLDAVLLDIDHSPTHVLDDGSAGFYGIEGMRAVASHLRTGGVYAMWSNDPPEPEYVTILTEVFADVAAEVITFPNPLQHREATATVYVATKA
jgi:spermidine synthase